MHVAGGTPAGKFNDLSLSRICLVPRLLPGERAAADKGYRDNQKTFITPVQPFGSPTLRQKIKKHN